MAVLAAIEENERSKRIIRIAYDLATTYDDTLVALHVIPEEESTEHVRSMQEVATLEDFSVTDDMEGAKQFAREFVIETIGDVVEARGRVGDVADEILAEADRIDPRYLVISGRRRSPAGKAIFGNTAQRILLNADCPVVSKLSDT